MNITPGSLVIIRKYAVQPEALVRTASASEHIDGINNGEVSLPIDYEVEGILSSHFEVGKSLVVERHRRNDVATPGIMMTSPITKIYQGEHNWTFDTGNSKYIIYLA